MRLKEIEKLVRASVDWHTMMLPLKKKNGKPWTQEELRKMICKDIARGIYDKLYNSK